jgi:hypothetical protein
MKTNKVLTPEEKANQMVAVIYKEADEVYIPSKIRVKLAIWGVNEILSTDALVYEELSEDELNPTHEQYWVLVREYLRRM